MIAPWKLPGNGILQVNHSQPQKNVWALTGMNVGKQNNMNYLSLIKARGSAKKILTEVMAKEIILSQGLDYSYEIESATAIENGSTLVVYKTVNARSQMASSKPIKPLTRVICFRQDQSTNFNMIAG